MLFVVDVPTAVKVSGVVPTLRRYSSIATDSPGETLSSCMTE